MKVMFISSLGELFRGQELVPDGAWLTRGEKSFRDKTWKLQEKFYTGRFRIHGTIKNLRLVTEFIAFLDDETAWIEIHKTVKQVRAKLSTMAEYPHLDRMKKVGDHEWTIGKDDGRMEKQVELSWNISLLTEKMIQEELKVLREKTESIWSKYGVAVI